jgi:predicted RNase H-like HicB family nuclease
MMKIKIVGMRLRMGAAEVPAIPGCATQGDSVDELMRNLREAIVGCLPIGRE